MNLNVSQSDTCSVSDEVLMLTYAQGHHSAFEQLYLKHKGGLYRYFVRQIGDLQLAEDLYQETWGRVIRGSGEYQVTAKFTTWLYRIAHNLLIDHIRAVKPVDSVEDIEQVQFESTLAVDINSSRIDNLDDVLIQEQKSILFKLCVSLLPQVQKEALLLNIETGLTAKVISEIVGASLEATKSRLRYAHIGLKECVSSKCQEVSDEQ